jgi:DNA-binding transcriptional ArsR family regulator
MTPRKDPDPGPVFSALADPTRREVLRRLSEDGPSTLSEISAGMDVTRQAVSKHLVLLEEAGLVASAGDTRRRTYHVTPGPLGDAVGWIADVGAEWDERLLRLRRLVERRTR